MRLQQVAYKITLRATLAKNRVDETKLMIRKKEQSNLMSPRPTAQKGFF